MHADACLATSVLLVELFSPLLIGAPFGWIGLGSEPSKNNSNGNECCGRKYEAHDGRYTLLTVKGSNDRYESEGRCVRIREYLQSRTPGVAITVLGLRYIYRTNPKDVHSPSLQDPLSKAVKLTDQIKGSK